MEDQCEGDEGDRAICVFAPVLLLTVTLETRGDDELELHVHCGGQGYWQARMARILGAEPVLCTILGGETGHVIQALVEDGIRLRAVSSPHPTAAYVHDRRGGERHEIARTNPMASGRHEQDELHNIALGEAASCGVCVMAGTHENPTLAAELYERLAADLNSLGVSTITDITGDLLRASLASGVDVVKLSDEELVADGWASGDSDADVRSGIEALRHAGARNVVVSRRERGVLAWYDGALLAAKAPQLSVADPRGAGDSMTAALTVSRRLGLGAPDALRLATAAAAVNVTRHGLASGDGETIRKLVPHVAVEQIT
jgi:1-phosphofructokinase